MNAREAATEARKWRIVRTARTMIGELGHTGLTMRALAAEADVSPATVYNQFGSKEGIIRAVLDADVAAYLAKMPAARKGQPVDQLFFAIDTAIALYASEPKFYRALFQTMFSVGALDMRRTFTPPRHRFWFGLVVAAQKGGDIQKRADCEALSLVLENIFVAALIDWVTKNSDLQYVAAELGYGFAICLSGVATKTSQRSLTARVWRYQAAMTRLLKPGQKPRRHAKKR